MTITYEYEGALYVNLTNRCNCNCEFCLRHGKKEGSIYTEDSLWLEREPTRQEALDSFLSRDVCSYREIVFCGYGEPTYRIDDIVWLVDQLKERFGEKLPPVRINTNGHANLIQGRDVLPDLKGRVDTLSISLNANTAAEYVEKRRLDVAKQMLIGTATAISEIAARLAFPSAAAFSRLFERCAGCSPADYRHC